LSKTNKGKGWGAGELHRDYVKKLGKMAAKPLSKAAAKARAEKPKKRAATLKTKG
jgi:carnitine 3-dehydrogenase